MIKKLVQWLNQKIPGYIPPERQPLPRTFEAVADDNLEVLKELISKGHDPEELDAFQRTMLHYVALRGYIDFAQYLVDELKVRINHADMNQHHPLHFAAQENEFEMLEFLLDHGSEIDCIDKFGNTPLFKAVYAYEKDGRGLEILLSRGANPDIKNFHGVSPRILAYTIANTDVRKYFAAPKE